MSYEEGIRRARCSNFWVVTTHASEVRIWAETVTVEEGQLILRGADGVLTGVFASGQWVEVHEALLSTCKHTHEELRIPRRP